MRTGRCRASGQRRQVASQRPRPLPPAGPSQLWADDFVFDAGANGQQLKCLTIIDEWTLESLEIEMQGGIRSARMIEVLSRLIRIPSAPQYLRSDNVLTVESSSNTGAQASEAVSDVLYAPHPLLLEDARGLPRSRRSPDLTIMNTRSCERPRPYLKQHGVPWKARTLSTGS